MNLYELPKFNFSKIKIRKKGLGLITSVVCLSIVFGFLAGTFSSIFFYFQTNDYLDKLNVKPGPINEQETYISEDSQEKAVIRTVEKSSPAVVSIIITKDLPVFEEFLELNPFGYEHGYRQKGTEKKEIGGGTGFIVSKHGLVLTNKHVVLDQGADYTVFTNDGRKFPAKVLAKDPFEDLAILKIDQENLQPFPVLKLGDSDNLEIGQTVIAIGNALGEFRNTVSTGVISGLGRKITASGGDFVETLEDVIQTDAAINKGNSGGPLLNLKGEVIGINTAMVIGAQSIGFAVPINKAKRDIEQVQTLGKIVYPFLGIRYVLLDEGGALVLEVEPGSAAQEAGLKKDDIVLEFNHEKITTENTLAKLITKYNPGDEIVLKILRVDGEVSVEVTLGERSE